MKDLVIGQAKINKNLTKKLSYNDKIIENINAKLETLCSYVKSQTSFNKMIVSRISIGGTPTITHTKRISKSRFQLDALTSTHNCQGSMSIVASNTKIGSHEPIGAR